MNKLEQLSKKHWIKILLAVGLFTTSIIVFMQNKEIKRLKYEVTDLVDKISYLQYEKEVLQIELKNCNSDKDKYENGSYSQTSNNWSIQNENDDLNRKIRDLEDELDECERKLRYFN